MQKFEKNQQKINFLQLWGHLKTLKLLINFYTILKVLERSNFLLLLCSKRKTKNIFTPPYCTAKAIYTVLDLINIADQYFFVVKMPVVRI